MAKKKKKLHNSRKSFLGSQSNGIGNVMERMEDLVGKDVEFNFDESCNHLQVGLELFYYVNKKNLRRLKEEIEENGKDVNVQDKDLNTPLHHAVILGYCEIVEFLVGCFGIDVNIKNKKGNTPLHLAFKKQDFDVIDILVLHGNRNRNIDFNYFCQCDFSSSNYELLKPDEMQEEETDYINNKNEIEEKFFEELKTKGFTEDLKKIANEIDLGIKDKNDQTALQIVCEKLDNWEAVKYFARIRCKKGDIEKCKQQNYIPFLELQNHKNLINRMLLECMQTERKFLDDLQIAINLFPEKEFFGESKASQILNEFKEIWSHNIQFFKKFQKLDCKDPNYQNKVIEMFKNNNFNYQIFVEFISTSILFLSEKKNKAKEVFREMEKQEKKIPKPKVQQFLFLIERPRDRLIKYQNLLKSIRKESERCKEVKIQNQEAKVEGIVELELVNSAISAIDNALKKIDAKQGDFDDFKKLQKLEMMIQKRGSYELLKKDRNGIERKYIFEDKEVMITDAINRVHDTIEFYLCNNLMIIWSNNNNSFQFIELDEPNTKVVAMFTKELIRFEAYFGKRKHLCYILVLGYPSKWLDFFKKIDYHYNSSLLILDNLGEVESIRKFVKAPKPKFEEAKKIEENNEEVKITEEIKERNISSEEKEKQKKKKKKEQNKEIGKELKLIGQFIVGTLHEMKDLITKDKLRNEKKEVEEREKLYNEFEIEIQNRLKPYCDGEKKELLSETNKKILEKVLEYRSKLEQFYNQTKNKEPLAKL